MCYLLRTSTGKSPNPNQIATPYVKVVSIKHLLSSNNCLVKCSQVQAFWGQYFIEAFILEERPRKNRCSFITNFVSEPPELLRTAVIRKHTVTNHIVFDGNLKVYKWNLSTWETSCGLEQCGIPGILIVHATSSTWTLSLRNSTYFRNFTGKKTFTWSYIYMTYFCSYVHKSGNQVSTKQTVV